MKADLVEDIVLRFARVAGKYRSLEDRPLTLPDGTRVFGSEMHMAVAVGEGRAATATELARLYGVTKGAVSQAVKRLEAKGILRRETAEGDEKTRVLSLTAKGRELQRLHERLHGASRPLFDRFLRKYDLRRLNEIREFLEDAEELVEAAGGGTR
jgi:DNA-binding MarR family transcriptional regulator